MRIAHIITRMIVGGAQENTLLNCRDLVETHNDNVLLITGPATGPEGDLLEKVGAGGIPTRIVPSLIRAIHPARDLQALNELKKILRDFQPDVVHTHSAKGGMLGRMAAWSLKTPAVLHTVHGAPFHPYQSAPARWLFQQCERYAARRCHRLISVADAMTDLMVEANIAPREKFITIYSGMEVDPFLQSQEHRAQVRAELGFRDDDIVIGKIARLFHLKGHEYVLQAAPQVVKANPQVKFLFVGDGLLRGELEREVERLGLQGHVKFAGLVHPARIPEMLSAMDLLVHASLREGLARALPQALLSGKPAISFDVNGAREVVKTEKTGFLVPPKDWQALADAMIRLSQDEQLRQQLGAQGRENCRIRFDHHYMTARIREQYEELLKRTNSPERDGPKSAQGGA